MKATKKSPSINANEVLTKKQLGEFSSFYFLPHEFEGKRIIFRSDGYLNMTKIANEYGKRLDHFWINAGTVDYLGALEEITGIPGNILIQPKKGRNGGTFCHPKLAVFFARWLDYRFAVWCDLMIDNILKGHLQVEVVVPTLEAQKQMIGIPLNYPRG